MGDSWLDDFLAYGSYGVVPYKLRYWSGISAIAGCLRRKCFFDQRPHYEWSPNFYILFVGRSGTMKTAAIKLSMSLLKRVEGIKFGPDITTWQSLIERIEQAKEPATLPTGEIMDMSCLTIPMHEFGSFFDPTDRNLADNLTNLWDNGRDVIEKSTKTVDSNYLHNPWVNFIGGTTPSWLAANFPVSLARGGFASRCIYVEAGDVVPTREKAYPNDNTDLPAGYNVHAVEDKLVQGLTRIARFSGEAALTPEAREWGMTFFVNAILAAQALDDLPRDFAIRRVCQLHKIAMVLSASRYAYPEISLADMLGAEAAQVAIERDAEHIMGFVGQSEVSMMAKGIAEMLERHGSVQAGARCMGTREMYKRHFFNVSYEQFAVAVHSAVMAGLVYENRDASSATLMLR